MAKSWGFSITLAATLSPLANGAARVFWGWASDRLGRENTMIFTFVLQAICLVGVATLGQLSSAWFAATLVAVYFTWGQIYSLFPSTSGDYFGARSTPRRTTPCSTPPRAWRRSSAAGSAHSCSNARAAGRSASTAAR
jgi:MFS family permease